MKTECIKTEGQKKNNKSGEKGQALLLILVLLIVGIIIISSSFAFIGTSIKTNKVYINNTNDLYAAESGVQDGTYNVVNQSISGLNTLFSTPPNNIYNNPTYADYDYNNTWNYNLLQKVNNDSVSVKIKNVWVPLIDDNNPSWFPTVTQLLPPDGVITPPSPTEANSIIGNTNLVVSGVVTSAASKIYKVNISYQGSVSLPIISIGVWLPQGFTYNTGSSNLQGIYSTEQLLKCAGNEAVVWTFSSTTFSSLLTSLGQAGSGNITLAITFTYSTSLTSLPYALAWIVNTPVGTIQTGFPYPYTWNADIKVYDLISDAGNTEVEAYVPTSETRELGDAISGDYVAAGGSLMVIGNGYTPMNDPNSDYQGTRYQLLSDSSSIVSTIPSDASLVGAYLYWSGWIDSLSKPLSATYGENVNFEINGNQVSFNSGGNPNRGNGVVSSTKDQWRSNAPTGTGYSYSCYADVTELVNWELRQENPTAANYSGNATYDVGPAAGCTLGVIGNAWSYAGWSIIIIYSGPTTLGHQLYLYDKFSYADNGMDIDITGNTTGPGGVISGFIVPPQVTGDVNAAKLTAFIGDGDWCFSDDFIAINAPSSYLSNPLTIPDSYKLWDGINLPAPTFWKPYGDPGLPNTASQPDNVWNSYSQTGGAADGIDIKTFNITWASGLVKSGDTSARIDLPTAVDSWNFVYMILSFRSSVSSGGAISYIIRGSHQ
jgi:Tfp pilus assembly protein PilX